MSGPVRQVEIAGRPIDDLSSAEPQRARQPFQCLLFRIHGMTLAVPLAALHGIVEWRQEVTPLPGQPKWLLGLMLHRGEQIKVVDTACLLLPERFPETERTHSRGSHLLLFGDGRWGLVCDALLKPRVLESDQVRWQAIPPLRPWMAGTLIEQLCVLLDLDGLFGMIGHD